MITNFEKITAELSNKEKSVVPIIRHLFQSHIGKERAVKAPEFCKKITQTISWSFSEVRLRKVINYLRKNALLPIIGTSQGYYLSYSNTELDKEIKSLLERANAIIECAKGLQKFKENWKERPKLSQISILF
jgi:hypothetical protein